MLSVLRRATTRGAPRTVLATVLSKGYASTLTPHTTGGHSSDSRVITPPTNEQRSLNAQVPTSAHTISGVAGNSGDQTNIDQNSFLSLITRRPYSLITHHSGTPNNPAPTRRFTVNGTIDDPQGLFYVVPNNDTLVTGIRNMAYIMITGHRGSGKSTRCWYTVHNELQGYEPLVVSLQLVDPRTEDSFWKTLGDTIKGMWEWPPGLPDIVDKGSFVNFFRFHKDKRIVLFLDEFDLVLQNNSARSALYDALRGMKEKTLRPSTYGLQAVIAIGPFNIIGHTPQQLSPFNVADHWDIPYFTLAQVENMFREFQQLAKITLEDGIIPRIFEITSGHPGLVCFCGKQIQEVLIPGGERHLTLHRWKEYESAGLSEDVIFSWQTVRTLSKEVKAPAYADYLIRNVLSKHSPPKYDEDNPVQSALIGLGALTKTANKLATFPSPLIRQIIMTSLAKSFKPILDPDSFGVSASGVLDVLSLMRMIKFFQASRMREAPYLTFKQNKTSGADVKAKDSVPHEDTYVFQLFLVLKAAVPDDWSVFPRMKGPDSSQVDIVVEDAQSQRVVLELMAHEPDGTDTTTRGTVMEHLHRASTKYAMIDNVTEVWVINFTTRQPSSKPKCGYVWPDDAGVVDAEAVEDTEEVTKDTVSVKIIHVWHDLAWTTAKITTRNKQGDAYAYTTTTVDLKQ